MSLPISFALLLAASSSAEAPASAGAPPPASSSIEPRAPEPPAASYNTCDRQPRSARFRITLPEQAELADLVRWMTTVSCRKFIWNPAVRGGKVTIIAPEPVTLDEAFAAFDSALESMGLTTEPAGEYLEIVETTGVEGRNLPVLGTDEAVPAGDRFVTRLVRPAHADPGEVVDVLSRLKSAHGSVDQAGELVIVTDTGSSVRRLLDVLAQIDLPPADDLGLFAFTLAYADPEAVKDVVLEVFGEAGGGAATRTPAKPTRSKTKDSSAASSAPATRNARPGSPAVTRVVVDARTRSLVMILRRDELSSVRALVERLDLELPGQAGHIHLVKLRHADPEEVAAVLGTFVKSGTPSGDGKTPTVRDDVTVTADPATRSLLVEATPHDFAGLAEVIEGLDVERRQLYIEVYLLEVTVDHLLQAGASGHFARANAKGDVSFVKSTPAGAADSVAPFEANLAGLAAGILGRSVFVPQLGEDLPSFGVVLQAIATDSDVNVVSEPHIYAADNKTAKISVGHKVPVQTGVSTPGGPGGNNGNVLVPVYTREDVSLTLEITPHVNDDEEITMDVTLEDEEIEDIKDGGQVTSSQRTLELDDVVARDGQPVVLGGLVKEVERIGDSKVPGLGSVPLLGWLFKSHRREKKKLNLLVVLVPHVLDSPDDAHRIHARRMQERQEFLERESAFQRRDLATHVNYRKKSGLLATVDGEARRMQSEAADVAAAARAIGPAPVEEIGAAGPGSIAVGP